MLCGACTAWCEAAGRSPHQSRYGTWFAAILHPSVDDLDTTNPCQLCAMIRTKLPNKPPEHEQPSASAVTQCVVMRIAVEFRRHIGELEICVCALSQAQEIASAKPWDGDYTWATVAYVAVSAERGLPGLLEHIDHLPADHSGSDSTFGLIKYWLDHCTKNHTCASSEQSNTVLPTRLIDVGSDKQDPRLVETHGRKGTYTALSHCWGVAPSQRPLTTTRSTFETRTASIPLRLMSRTFAEAIIVTRRLGIPYVWIDSLCIIQDDAADWEKEAAIMCDVYSGARLTIAASDSVDGSGGLFRRRDGRLRRPCLLPLDTGRWKGWSGCPVAYYDVDESGVYKPGNEAPRLQTRAWTFQEKLLSPRYLSYDPEMVTWQCLGGHYCEDDPAGLDQDSDDPLYHLHQAVATGKLGPGPGERGSRQVFAVRASKTRRGPKGRMRYPDDWVLWQIWMEAVTEYSRRDLTYSSDKLAAIAGVALALQLRTESRYLAGLWRPWLLYDLCWKTRGGRSGEPAKRYEPAPAPSWSWASVSGTISNTLTNQSDDFLLPLPLAQLLRADAPSAATKKSTEGTVALRGHTRQLVVKEAPRDTQKRLFTTWSLYPPAGTHDEDARLAADFYPDDPARLSSATQSDTLLFIALVNARENPSFWERDGPIIICLALSASDNSSSTTADAPRWRRAGLAEIELRSWTGALRAQSPAAPRRAARPGGRARRRKVAAGVADAAAAVTLMTLRAARLPTRLPGAVDKLSSRLLRSTWSRAEVASTAMAGWSDVMPEWPGAGAGEGGVLEVMEVVIE